MPLRWLAPAAPLVAAGELAILAASLGAGGPVADGVRVVGLVVVVVTAAWSCSWALCSRPGLLAQQQPPYPM